MDVEELTSCAEVGDAGPVLAALSVWTYSAVLLFLALVPLVLILRNLRLARSAHGRRAEQELRKGAAVVKGTVMHPAGSPLRVEISQSGLDLGQSGMEWTESGRSVHAEPFRLRTASGQEVDVLADDNVKLLLEMERTEPIGSSSRLRIAEVHDGDTIYVSGRVALRSEVDPSAGYRGGMRTRAELRPAGSAGMLVSRNPLERVFLKPIRAYAAALGIVLVLFAGLHAAYAGYHARRHAGQLVAAEVVDKRVDVDSEGHETRVIEVAIPGSDNVVVTPTRPCYERVEPGYHIAVLFARYRFDFWQVGREASVNLGVAAIAFAGLTGGFIAYAVILAQSRKWYAGRLLDES